MTYLFSQYWIFIALAVVLGLFVGWATRGGGPSSAGGWVGWAIAWFLVGLFVAVFKWLPGLAGHLLEVALLLFGAFVIGCIAGCGARGAAGGDDADAAEHGHGAGGHGAPGAAQASAAPVAHTHEDVLGVDSSASYPGARPAAAAAGAKTDDLTVIAGVDSGTAKALGDIGVSQYSQIAGWGAPQTAWVEHHLAQPERIGRENWIAQARNLASGKAPGVAAAAVAAAGGIATAASGASGSASAPAEHAKPDDLSATAAGGAPAGSTAATSGAPAAAEARSGATASGVSVAATPARGADGAAQAGAAMHQATTPAEASSAAPAAEIAAPVQAATSGAPSADVRSASAAGGAAVAPASADHASAGAPPSPGMTDGQRSILAAREKMAQKAPQAAALAAAAAAGDALAHGADQAAPAAASAPAHAPIIAPRANMTDGQRSILAARQRMAEKAERPVVGGEAATGGAIAPSAASATAAPSPQGVGEGRPAVDSSPNAPADDLKLIKGIGPKNEAALNGLGVRRFAQIADWTPENAQWVGHSIKFPGRIEREQWIPQAKFLAAGVDTPHSAAVKSGAIKIDDSADAPMSDAEAEAFASSLPQQAAAVDNEQAYAGARPLGLAGPRGGKADDLKLIKGIGRQNEDRLHALGVWHFDQIAAWSVENVKWIGSYLAFPGRIDREGWLAQAHALALGEKTEFAKRVEAGDVPSSKNLI